jgi:AraC-like DNA-binding protein
VLEVNGLLRELIVGLVAQAYDPLAAAAPGGASDAEPDYYAALVGLALLELKRAQHRGASIPMPEHSDRRLRSLCQAVIDAPSLDTSFEQHAEQVGASVRTLARLFQASMGVGFAQWRRQVQLATATAQLLQGLPVSRVAHALGYSPSSFSDMFRRERGMTPSAFVLEAGR